MIGSDSPFHLNSENTRGTGCEEFDQAYEGNSASVDELLQPQRKRGLETENAERCAVELDVFQRRLVRGVIGGNGLYGAVSEPDEERFVTL